MPIVFFCQSCGARFEVAPQAAGKRGRCRKCGQQMEVPRADQLASMVAMPAVPNEAAGRAAAAVVTPAAAVAPAAVASKAGAQPRAMSDWLRSAATSVGLSPLSVSSLPLGARNRKPSALDDAEDSKPYLLAGPNPYTPHGAASGAAGAVVRVWRREVGIVQRIFRWLNESAYLVSVPFIGIFLFGTATKSRGMALFGATFVVLLNIGRIVAGVANLAVVPLRSGLNVKNMRRPFRRVVEPVVTIGAIFLAFMFVPWLKPRDAAQGTVVERLKGDAQSLGGEMKGEFESAVDKARTVDVEKLGIQARERLRTIGTGPTEGPDASHPPAAAKPSADAAVGGLIKDLGQRVRNTVNEAQPQP